MVEGYQVETGENRVHDGEVDVWSVFDGQEAETFCTVFGIFRV